MGYKKPPNTTTPIGDGDAPQLVCGARRKVRRDEEPGSYFCQLSAGHGTEHNGFGRCKYHGGNTPSHVESARADAIRDHVATFGLPVRTTPTDALLEEVYRTAGHVRFLEDLVSNLPSTEDLKQLVEDKGMLWERPSVWIELYHTERKHLVAVTTAAIKCGIAERLVRLEESKAELLAQAIKGMLDELDVPLTEATFKVVSRHLRALNPAEEQVA